MPLNIFVVIVILFCHWMFDFVWQTEWQATNKYKNVKALLAHTVSYSLGWGLIGSIFFGFTYSMWMFVLITFLTHTLIDFITSRVSHNTLPKRTMLTCQGKPCWYFYQGESYHRFFVNIGFDQMLHLIQLYLTYYLLL